MTEQSDTATSPPSDKDLAQWAQRDALNDNARGSVQPFQSFSGRVKDIVAQYVATISKDFMDAFLSRSDKLQDGFTNVAGRLTVNPQTFIQNVEIQAINDIADADKRYASNITSLERELSEWETRFQSGFSDGIANPKKQNAFWHWGVILFLLAIEVILNSRFFAETSEYGLLGGTMAAVAISVVNVGLPTLVGYFAHKLYYGKGAVYKNAGLLLTAVLVVCAAAFNYYVAEFRDELLAAAGKPPSPLPEYLALFVIGGGIAVISFWKMFSFMDPYLRPRRCYQNKEEATREYENLALKSIKGAQNEVKEILKDIAVQTGKAEAAIQSESNDFDFRCAEAIRVSNEKIGYYHLHYCPFKANPDPERPDLGDDQYDFSAARTMVSQTIRNLEETCRRANDEWSPILIETSQGLVAALNKYQGVVVANLAAAIARARDGRDQS